MLGGLVDLKYKFYATWSCISGVGFQRENRGKPDFHHEI